MTRLHTTSEWPAGFEHPSGGRHRPGDDVVGGAGDQTVSGVSLSVDHLVARGPEHEAADEHHRDDEQQLGHHPRVAEHAHLVPMPRATPVSRAAKLNGMQKTRLNMLSVLTES